MDIQIGATVPDFPFLLQDGSLATLSAYRGKRLLLYFYPKDHTPGCTAQACNLRDGYSELRARGVEILGVSTNTDKSHVGFIVKHNLPFALVADVNHELAEAFGVWREKRMAGRTYMGIVRTSFLISPEGVVEHIISKVKTKDHTQQVLDYLNSAPQ